MFCSIKNSKFIKSLVNLFLDIALTFFYNSLNPIIFDVTSFTCNIKICLFYEISNITFVY